MILFVLVAKKSEEDAVSYVNIKATYIPNFKPIVVIDDAEPSIVEDKKILFAGDSRFVGMSQIEDVDEVFLAKVGEGYSYLCSLQEDINNEDADVIIIGFGVNDLHHVNDYIEYLNSQPFDKEIYFLTVNPVNEQVEAEYGYTVTNNDIDEFNRLIKEGAINYAIIDTNSYLWETGFDTKDGLHYKDETYQRIYEYVLENFHHV